MTSRSQGSRQLSIRMSNPSSSKQLDLKGTYCSIEVKIIGSAERIVFIMISSIFFQMDTSSIPYSLNAFLKAVRDHFDPTPSALGSVLATKLGLFLFKL